MINTITKTTAGEVWFANFLSCGLLPFERRAELLEVAWKLKRWIDPDGALSDANEGPQYGAAWLEDIGLASFAPVGEFVQAGLLRMNAGVLWANQQ